MLSLFTLNIEKTYKIKYFMSINIYHPLNKKAFHDTQKSLIVILCSIFHPHALFISNNMLLNSHAFCEIARCINITTPHHRDVIRQQLQRDNRKQW